VGESFVFFGLSVISLQRQACHFLPTKLADSQKHRQNHAKKSHEIIFGPSVFSVQTLPISSYKISSPNTSSINKITQKPMEFVKLLIMV
jgi:hypothetical protein